MGPAPAGDRMRPYEKGPGPSLADVPNLYDFGSHQAGARPTLLELEDR